MNEMRKRLEELEEEMRPIKHNLDMARDALSFYGKELERLQKEYEVIDRKLAMVDGRLKKVSRSRSGFRKVNPFEGLSKVQLRELAKEVMNRC